MKKIHFPYLIVPAILGILVCSCQKEQSQDNSNTLTVEFAKAVKALVDADELAVSFEPGDNINVLAGGNIKFTSTQGGERAIFNGPACNTEGVVAIYPYTSDFSDDSKLPLFNFPEIVDIEKGICCNAIGYGTISNSSVTLNHATAFITFEISEGGIDGITVKAPGGENLAGSYALVGSADEKQPLHYVQEGSSAITLNGAFVKGKYIVAIPPQAYNSGLCFVLKSGTNEAEVSRSTSIKLDASKVKNFGPIDEDIHWKSGLPPMVKVKVATSSTLAFACTLTDWKDEYADVDNDLTFALYNDEACTDLRVSWNITKKEWISADVDVRGIGGPHSPSFIFSGLKSDTDYYCKVWLTNSPEKCSDVIKGHTLASEVVLMQETEAKVGDVILSEDFGELVYGGDIADYNFGYSDKNRSTITSLDNALGINPLGEQAGGHNFYLVYPGTEMGLFNTLGKAIGTTRLQGWTSIAEDNSDGKVLARPGYIKLGASSKTGAVVTPAINCIPEGKKAKIKVSFLTHPYIDSATDPLGMTVETISTTATGSVIKEYSVGEYVEFMANEDNKWTLHSEELNVFNGERIAIGTRRLSGNTSGQCRVILDDIKLEITELIDYQKKVLKINNADDFVRFTQDVRDYEDGETVTVEADIDLKGAKLTPAATFKGILDGQNHVIKNFTIKENKDRVGVFETIDGNAVIKNITFGAEGGGSKIILDRTGQSGGYCYAAPIAYVAGAASLDNVTSYCDVEVSSATISQSRAGGITGMWNSSGTLKGCRNYGKVSNNTNSQATTNINAVAGIVAQADKAAVIENCENYGAVTNSNKYTQFIAGVLARTAQTMTIRGCKNFGTISNKADIAVSVEGQPSLALVMGGIVASANAGILQNDCVNEGTVENTGSATGITMAGINAHIYGNTISGCTNTGYLHNNAVTATTYIGGIAAYGQSAQPTFTNCVNTGTILNEAREKLTTVNIGGIYGRAHQTATFSGCVNGESGSSTKGAIANNASASDICIGGILGYDQACSSLNNQKNHGPISMTDVVSNNPRVGGIAGYGNHKAITFTGCENNGDITVHLAKSKQCFIGGVFADTPNHDPVKDFSGNINHGKVSLKLDEKDDSGFYYLGGVSGTKATGIKYSNCTNTGDISFEGPAKMRIGGIAGYTNQKVDNASVNCNITAKCTDNNFSEVGGVVGYTAMVDMNNWNFEGTINTSASTAKVYTGGLLGKTNGSSKFNGCKFKGTLTGAAGNNVPGLYVGGLQANGFTITFGNTSACKVGTGCVVNGNAITELTNANLVSQSSDNGTFTANTTLTAISITD